MNLRKVMVALPLVIMMLAAACTSDAGTEGIPTAGRAPSPSPTPAPDDVARELEFVACMRAAGIDMPDPIPGDTSGRSALKQAMDKGMGLKDSFQTALDGCMSHLPPPPKAPPVDPEQVEKKRKFAQCMRDNGVKDFPDPDPATGELNGWIRQDDNNAMAASEKCMPLLPPPPTSGPLAEPTQ